MKFKGLFVGLFVLSMSVNGQQEVAKKYGEQITGDDLKEYLSILASDALEGRETGTRGQKMAAAFIAAHFQELGLAGPVDGSYYQPIDLYTSSLGEAYAKAGATRLDNYQDIIYYGSAKLDAETSLRLVFA